LENDETGRRLQKENLSLSEALLHHFLVTPPSHFMPQKVEGFVVGLISYGGSNYSLNFRSGKKIVKGIFAFGNGLGFQAQIDDLPLKCCILEEKAEGSTSVNYLHYAVFT
jgi:hypothetical protein